jgi:two-component system chemotaxis response regulator CheB
MNGFSFLRWVMSAQPVPVLVLSSHDSHASVFHAMELGAADFMAKPTPRASLEILTIKRELCAKLELIASVGLKAVMSRTQLLSLPAAPRRQAVSPPPVAASPVRLVVIGASTGGPPAIQAIVRELPPAFLAPIIIVQHMPPVFTTHFAERLNSQCPLRVTEAAEGDLLEPGRVLVVPGDVHLTLERTGSSVRAHLIPKEERDPYIPSIDLTMKAAAELFAGGVLGVLLTGMGHDGKEGMLAIKRHGGQTIAESEETAAIYGMPREAVLAGAVDLVLPLSAIGSAVIGRVMPG